VKRIGRGSCTAEENAISAAYRRRPLTIIGAHLVASGANKSRCYVEFVIRGAARGAHVRFSTRAERARNYASRLALPQKSAAINRRRLIRVAATLGCSPQERRESLLFPNRLSQIMHRIPPPSLVLPPIQFSGRHAAVATDNARARARDGKIHWPSRSLGTASHSRWRSSKIRVPFHFAPSRDASPRLSTTIQTQRGEKRKPSAHPVHSPLPTPAAAEPDPLPRYIDGDGRDVLNNETRCNKFARGVSPRGSLCRANAAQERTLSRIFIFLDEATNKTISCVA